MGGRVPLMKSSGSKTSDAQIFTGDCVLRGFLISTDGTNDVTIDLYDNTSASGTELCPTFTVLGANLYGGCMSLDVSCRTGIYLDITTTGTADVVVYYHEGF